MLPIACCWLSINQASKQAKPGSHQVICPPIVSSQLYVHTEAQKTSQCKQRGDKHRKPSTNKNSFGGKELHRG